MSETFYKRVSVKEELPEKSGDYHTINDSDISMDNYLNTTYFANTYKKWRTNKDFNETVIYWLKPLPILSRDKMIEVIRSVDPSYEYNDKEDTWPVTVESANEILDTILKAGLPEKKVTVEIKSADFRSAQMGTVRKAVKDYSFCTNCGVKINWT